MVALTLLWMEYGSKQTHQIGFSGKKKYGKRRRTKNTIIITMNKTNRRGCGPYKKRRSNKAGTEDNQMIYMRGLSTQVRKACDEWLDKRGLKAKSWMQQKEDGAKKKKT